MLWPADIAYRADPALMMSAAGIPPDPWQVSYLRSRAPRLILNCGRQTGKSTATAGKAVNRVCLYPDSLALLLSPSMRQVRELAAKIDDVYRGLPGLPDMLTKSASEMTFANGSRIVSLPSTEGTIRGFSKPDLVIIDEAAWVTDALYNSVRPMLATSTNGQLILLSTPFGKEGFFARAWHAESSVWQRHTIKASDCPRISPAFLQEERDELGEWWYEQEYECAFKDSVDQLFSTDSIKAAFADDQLQPLNFGGVVHSLSDRTLQPLFSEVVQ